MSIRARLYILIQRNTGRIYKALRNFKKIVVKLLNEILFSLYLAVFQIQRIDIEPPKLPFPI